MGSKSGLKTTDMAMSLWKRYNFYLLIVLTVIASLILILLVFQVGSKTSRCDYIGQNDIQRYDVSQLETVSDQGYDSWYDWDKRSGRVYIVISSGNQVTNVTPAYGPNGKPLYVNKDMIGK